MYKINLEEKSLQKISEVPLSELKVKERYDLQEWLATAPEVFDVLDDEEGALLIISKELAVNADAPNGIRADLIALDRKGRLVVIELKRGEARGDVDWQAIKYAARCSRYTPAKLIEIATEFMKKPVSEVGRAIYEHISGNVEEGREYTDEEIREELSFLESDRDLLETRIVLVAQQVNPEVASSALWLRKFGIDVSCLAVKAHRDDQAGLFLTVERVIPLPEEDDYTATRSKKGNSQTGRPRTGASKFGDDVSNFDDEDLEKALLRTLDSDKGVIPRVKLFLQLLAAMPNVAALSREEMKAALVQAGFTNDIGHAGRLLSNISQFVTKPKNRLMRQLITYEGGEGAGALKDNYRLRSEAYKALVQRVLEQLPPSI
jgi:hypothetical protein